MNQENIYIDKLLTQYFPHGSWSINQGPSGMNNTTRYIEAGDMKYVLRIYETHKDIDKVKYEHEMLLALSKMHLPFSTPIPVHTSGGETIVTTEDGKIAGLFRYIEGSNPTLNEAFQLISFGRATARLTHALEGIRHSMKPVYRPYYEIENTHPRCSIEAVLSFCTNPTDEFIQHQAVLLQIAEQLANFRESIQALKKLPHQLIHGDLNVSNVLADEGGKVTAILDFEFITEDLRVMELCVCLSDLIRTDESEVSVLGNVNAFLSGYGEAIKLFQEEIAVIPLLLLLRRLDVFIHFLGRYWDGINKIQVVESQMLNVASQIEWLKANGDRLVALCMRHASYKMHPEHYIAWRANF